MPEKNISKGRRSKFTYLPIISLIIGIIPIMIAGYSLYINFNTAINNDAVLEISSRPFSEEVRKINIIDLNSENIKNLDLHIINKGRLESRAVNVNIDETWLHEENAYIENIPAGESRDIKLRLKNRNCDRNKDCPELDNQLKSGIRRINVHLNCTSCEDKEQTKVITVCLVNKDSDNCNIWQELGSKKFPLLHWN